MRNLANDYSTADALWRRKQVVRNDMTNKNDSSPPILPTDKSYSALKKDTEWRCIIFLQPSFFLLSMVFLRSFIPEFGPASLTRGQRMGVPRKCVAPAGLDGSRSPVAGTPNGLIRRRRGNSPAKSCLISYFMGKYGEESPPGAAAG